MAIEKYSIGGAIQDTERTEAFADIPQNRVLLTEKLTINAPVKPEIIEGLTNIEQVFEHFNPKVEVGFETEEGNTCNETLSFKNLGDFGVKGITGQSKLLNELTIKKNQYHKIIRQLKANKVLRQVLSDSVSKNNMINVLHALIEELENAD